MKPASSPLNRRQCLAVLATASTAAAATPEALHAAIQSFTEGQPWRAGRVQLDIAALVENGNAVPVTVSVASTMQGSERVRAIALFTERNPLPDVAQFTLGAQLPRAVVHTRMRLATSQRVLALAKLADGRCFGTEVEVVVTLAACIES